LNVIISIKIILQEPTLALLKYGLPQANPGNQGNLDQIMNYLDILNIEGQQPLKIDVAENSAFIPFCSDLDQNDVKKCQKFEPLMTSTSLCYSYNSKATNELYQYDESKYLTKVQVCIC
jgi:hypothetical protein